MKTKKLKLKLNIGSEDAKRLELDKTLEGEIVEVDEKTADELLKRAWATDDLSDPPAPKSATGVAPLPNAGRPRPDEFDVPPKK